VGQLDRVHSSDSKLRPWIHTSHNFSALILWNWRQSPSTE
jgi:hypothetical protein